MERRKRKKTKRKTKRKNKEKNKERVNRSARKDPRRSAAKEHSKAAEKIKILTVSQAIVMNRRMNCAHGQTKTRRVDVFHQNVLRAVAVDSRPIHRLDREAVILVPH